MWNYLLTINEEEKADEQVQLKDAFINIIDKFDSYEPILVFALVLSVCLSNFFKREGGQKFTKAGIGRKSMT